jgi:hypothetical protein
MTAKFPKSIEAALLTIVNGFADEKRVEAGAGRPSQKRIVNGILLDRHEYDIYETLVEFWKQAKDVTKNDILTDEQFVVFMKEAAPKINQRMINMAMVSDDLKAVRQVAADLADRGYGRASSQININISDKDIRGAWRQLEDKSIIEATNLIEVIDTEDDRG